MAKILSNTSKMPGKSISLDANICKTGSKLAKVKGSVCHDCAVAPSFFGGSIVAMCKT